LIEKAAKTSEEIAKFLDWTNDDIIAIVKNTPKSKKLFN
jgi:predicted transcriptional regulator